MQACLYEPLYYEWTIWRKPNSEMKRSGIELQFGEMRREAAEQMTWQGRCAPVFFYDFVIQSVKQN